jgi:hypothetical protein
MDDFQKQSVVKRKALF